MTNRDLEFLFEIGSLRNLQRSWRQTLGVDCASVSEHTFRVLWLSLIIAKRESEVDENKIMRMALVHDIAETRTSDHNYVHTVYVSSDEETATKDIFDETTLGDFLDVLKEYENRESLEAKIVKDADNLDVDFELKELEEQGSKLPEKWQEFRRKVRDEKLYTNSAKEIWDELQKTNVADWHLKSNKWVKKPEAGR